MYESVSQGANAPDRTVDAVFDLLSSERAGLVTDVDGTISPIVARPDDARVLPRARAALDGLKNLLELVAVVSGRTAANARAMVGLDGLTYIGNHGLEIWSDRGPEMVPEARPWVPRVAHALAEVAQLINVPGVLIENKGATASLHYRLAPDPEEARRALLEILAPAVLSSGLRLEEGRLVINLVPPLSVNKGSAVSWLAHEHQLTAIVYLGDDATDVYAFRALGELRQTGQAQTLSIAVGGPEAPSTVRQLADASMPSVEAVADLLSTTLERLRTSATMNRGAPTVGRETHG